jgi:hypothetical protein
MCKLGKPFQFCLNNGGKLAEIENEEDMEEIKDFLDLVNIDDDFKRYWIGLTDRDREVTFQWYSRKMPLAFANWNFGQPDGNDAEDEDCVCLDYNDRKGRWSDIKCSKSNYVALCQSK